MSSPPTRVDPGAVVDDRPCDHRVEWWYFFIHLRAVDGEGEWSIVTTLLKKRLPVWGWPTAWLAATQVVDARSPTRLCSGAIPALGCYEPAAFRWSTANLPFLPWWEMHRLPGAWSLRHRSRASFDLTLHDPAPPIFVGADGVMTYGGGHELGWYMRPFLTAEGTVTVGGREVRVQGDGWMERQWGWSPVESFAWRYLTLRLDDGRRFLLFRTRVDGHEKTWGIRIHADGTTTEVPDLALTDEATTDPFPTTKVRGGGLALQVTALPIDQLIRPGIPGAPSFYEGFSRVTGKVDGVDVTGVGVTELRVPSGSRAGGSPV